MVNQYLSPTVWETISIFFQASNKSHIPVKPLFFVRKKKLKDRIPHLERGCVDWIVSILSSEIKKITSLEVYHL